MCRDRRTLSPQLWGSSPSASDFSSQELGYAIYAKSEPHVGFLCKHLHRYTGVPHSSSHAAMPLSGKINTEINHHSLLPGDGREFLVLEFLDDAGKKLQEECSSMDVSPFPRFKWNRDEDQVENIIT